MSVATDPSIANELVLNAKILFTADKNMFHNDPIH